MQRYRAEFAVGSLFVGEFAIKKFFDNISHKVVRERWAEMGFAPAATKVFEAYLKVYSAKDAVRPECAPCQAKVQDSDPLVEDKPRRGLPQGGSISTVLATIIFEFLFCTLSQGRESKENEGVRRGGSVGVGVSGGVFRPP